MPISKEITKQGMKLGHHEVTQASTTFLGGVARSNVRILSREFTLMLPDEAPTVLEWVLHSVSNCGDLQNLPAIELALTLEGELAGGTIIEQPQTLSPLEYAQAKKWLQIKAAKSAEMTSPLTTPYGIFDCDAESEKRITGAIMMLQTLEGMGTPTTVDFVLADNSVVTLTTAQMVEVGLIMGARVQAAISKASGLRTAIEAATTVEEVEAVVWV